MVLQNPIQLPTHQVIPLPTTPNQDTKVDINNSNEMDNDFFEAMTNEIFNDNNPNVEKKVVLQRSTKSWKPFQKFKKSLSYMQLPTIVQINEVLFQILKQHLEKR